MPKRITADHQAAIGQPSLSEMTQMLRQVVAAGTGARAKIPGYDLAGKTGTTSDYRDAWFVGYTGGFVTAVWVGRDDNTPMKRVTGGGAPAEIWRGFIFVNIDLDAKPLIELLRPVEERFRSAGIVALPPQDLGADQRVERLLHGALFLIEQRGEKARGEGAPDAGGRLHDAPAAL